MARTFFDIYVKGSPISRYTLMELIEKYNGVWTNGRTLRTNKRNIAKRVKKELEKQFPHWVYIDIVNPDTGQTSPIF